MNVKTYLFQCVHMEKQLDDIFSRISIYFSLRWIRERAFSIEIFGKKKQFSFCNLVQAFGIKWFAFRLILIIRIAHSHLDNVLFFSLWVCFVRKFVGRKKNHSNWMEAWTRDLISCSVFTLRFIFFFPLFICVFPYMSSAW